ncbi:MAG: hypothetical protein U0T81_06185 [Saprospiraceae bacterium]
MEIVGLIRFFPLIVLLSIPKSAYSQSPALKVIDNKIDLYSRGPISLLRDSKGFLWIGTKFDLVKFDGQSKEYFTHDSENPNSILGRAVMDIFEDKDRVIWISFVNGVSRYNPTTNSFENFTKENGGIDTDFTEAHFFNVGYDLYASGIHRGLFKFDKKKDYSKTWLMRVLQVQIFQLQLIRMEISTCMVLKDYLIIILFLRISSSSILFLEDYFLIPEQ